jgi:hypothetical protein
MSKSSITEMEKEVGNQIQLFIWRIQNKHHDTMVKLQKQFNDINIKHGALRVEVFQVTNTDTYDGCTNISNTVSAKEDEEIWVELQSQRSQTNGRSHIRGYERRKYEGGRPACKTIYGSS